MTIVNIVKPRLFVIKTLLLVLKLYLAMFLFGCAGSRQKLSTEQVRNLQTHKLTAQSEEAFNASLTVLQDMNYSVDIVDKDLGLIKASRHTTERLGEITQESEKGLPTWAWVALIATGVILVVLLVSAVSSHDKDKHEEEGPDYYHSDHYDSSEPEGTEYYHYQITLKFGPCGETETQVRMSVQGSRIQGDKVMETGPVYDENFFREFYASLDKATTTTPADTLK